MLPFRNLTHITIRTGGSIYAWELSIGLTCCLFSLPSSDLSVITSRGSVNFESRITLRYYQKHVLKRSCSAKIMFDIFLEWYSTRIPISFSPISIPFTFVFSRHKQLPSNGIFKIKGYQPQPKPGHPKLRFPTHFALNKNTYLIPAFDVFHNNISA